jgi:hypothetical protein
MPLIPSMPLHYALRQSGHENIDIEMSCLYCSYKLTANGKKSLIFIEAKCLILIMNGQYLMHQNTAHLKGSRA